MTRYNFCDIFQSVARFTFYQFLNLDNFRKQSRTEFLWKNSHCHIQRGDVYVEFTGFNVVILLIHVSRHEQESPRDQMTRKRTRPAEFFSVVPFWLFPLLQNVPKNVPSVSKTTGLITLAERKRGLLCGLDASAGKTVTIGITT